FWGGWVDIARANPARAITRFEQALRMNPRSAVRPQALTGIGLGLLAQGEVARARAALREAVQYLPYAPVTLAALIVAFTLHG
ncbi:tetratricopeptide repeat protein, partial [Listeria monocytogenes]|nr:tetratricopeptide repeat protein [Listeria monocytogenes]